MTLLPQRLDDEAFTLLRHYLSDDSDKRKLFQPQPGPPDLYDQYLVYRPEWLMRWEADERVDGLGDAQQWQAPLWKALVEHTAALGQPLWHRANLYQRFISTLEAADEPGPGCLREFLFAGFWRCRRFICRRCRRWASTSMCMCCSPTPVVTTGAI